MDVALRPFEDDDLPRLRRWLAADHVRPWFEQPEDWMAEVEGRHGEYAWISHFVIEADGEPVGFCQLYPFSASGEDWNGALPVEGTYSLDYLLGEPTLLRRGIARAALAADRAHRRRTRCRAHHRAARSGERCLPRPSARARVLLRRGR